MVGSLKEAHQSTFNPGAGLKKESIGQNTRGGRSSFEEQRLAKVEVPQKCGKHQSPEDHLATMAFKSKLKYLHRASHIQLYLQFKLFKSTLLATLGNAVSLLCEE